MLGNWVFKKEKANSMVQAIIIITAIFVLVGIFLITYLIYFNRRKTKLLEEKQQLIQSQVEVQEQTFQQIGKELHDNVAQLLSTSRMLLGITERSLANPPETLLAANETLAKAISELRTLSKSLDKEWLEQFKFIDNLKSELTRINAGEKIKVSLSGQTEIELKPEDQIILFRIVQEAIQNAIKHGEPEKIEIEMSSQNGVITIRITDDGIGFDLKKVSKGMGLNNMSTRTSLLGGMIVWERGQRIGTIVNIHIPVKK